MTRRILAIVIALVFSIAGHLLVYVGGSDLLMRTQQFLNGPSNPLAVVGVIAGLILIAVAAMTIAVSSAGVIVVGALHVVFGLLTVLLPISLQFRPPTFQLTLLLRDLNAGMGDGMLFNFTLGTGFMTGVILLVAGIAVRGRTMRANPLAIIVSVAVSIIGFIGVFVAITGGSFIYRSMLQQLRGQVEVFGLALLLIGSVLLAATVITVRWSSAGTIVLGAVITVTALVWTLLSRELYGTLADVARDLTNALEYVASSGLLALVGVVLVAVGVGAGVRARRAAPTVEPSYAPGPVGTPTETPDQQVV